MNKFILFFIHLLTFITIDTIWLKYINNKFYLTYLPRLATQTHPATSYLAAIGVWALMLVGIYLFVIPVSYSWITSFGYGTLYGLIIYYTFNGTNLMILPSWSWNFIIIDCAWGSFVCGLMSSIVFASKKI